MELMSEEDFKNAPYTLLQCKDTRNVLEWSERQRRARKRQRRAARKEAAKRKKVSNIPTRDANLGSEGKEGS